MQQINVKGVGVVTEEQILNLIHYARRKRTENKVLKEEINSLKEMI